ADGPWPGTWADRQTATDTWSAGAGNHAEGEEGTWAGRRAAAKQASREWMPFRLGPGGVIYRGLRFGSLAELIMLDLRSYRAEQLGYDQLGRADDPDQVMAGSEQLAFLQRALLSVAQWQMVVNEWCVAPL